MPQVPDRACLAHMKLMVLLAPDPGLALPPETYASKEGAC